MMKLQACSFRRKKNSELEMGFAKVELFNFSDVEWIIDKNGEKIKTLWDYVLISDYPGCMAYLN